MGKLILGCGYLGKRLAARWRARGERVLGTTRQAGSAAELESIGVEPIVCDVLDPATLKRLPRVDTVVHCVGFDRHVRSSMRQVYVEGLANVIAATRDSPRFLHLSSSSVYAQSDGSVVTEGAAAEPIDESGKIVLEAEELLRQTRPEAIVLRFSGIYGPGRLIRARDLQCERLLAIDPEKWLNLIHVEDGARAVVAGAVLGQPGEVYNVSDGNPIRRREFYTALAELLGTAPPRFVPPPEPVPASERVNRRIDNGKMRRELGVKVQYGSYQEGLAASR